MTTSSSTTSTTTAISASAVHDPAIVAGVHKAERLGATGAETIRLLLAGGTMIAFGTSILVRTHRMRAQHL